MQKTKIDWATHTTNPIKGLCKQGCSYCYARRMYKRFKWDTKIRLDWGNFLNGIGRLKKPAKIFIGSTHDIFGDWIPDEWINFIIEKIKPFNQHMFLFLTKNPARYYKFPMPDNCWRGVTITKGEARVFPLVDSGIRFASFEPLLGEIQMKGCPFDWIILGSLTGPGSKKYQPKVEWIENILRQADEYNVPVFMKNSLSKIWNKPLCQKFPTTKGDK